MEATGHADKDLRDRALERLKKRRDFKTHIVMYVLVNAFLVVIWAVTTAPDFFWPIFPIIGWGFAVAANAWDVYGRKDITEDEIREETERLRGS